MCLPGSNHGTLRGLFCDEGRGAAVDVRSMCIERERPVRTHRAQGPRVKGGERWEHSSLDCRVVWVCAACACVFPNDIMSVSRQCSILRLT